MYMSKVYVTTIIMIIVFIVFNDINAHQNEVVGHHNSSLVYGSPHAIIYNGSPQPGSYTAYCSMWIEASNFTAENEIVKGDYEFYANAASDTEIGPMSGLRIPVGDSFTGDIFEWISDEAVCNTSPSGVAAEAGDEADVAKFMKMIINGRDRLIPINHIHSTEFNSGDEYARWHKRTPSVM